MRSHVSEVSQRGVRQPLARFLVSGLLLGLTFSGLVACKTTGGTGNPEPPVTAPPQCKRYDEVVEIDFTSDGLVFSPSRCLRNGGTVRFVNRCSREADTTVSGPARETVPRLPPGAKDELRFRTKGLYVITVMGCSDTHYDSKTGTLEVGSGTEGDPARPGATEQESHGQETGASTPP